MSGLTTHILDTSKGIPAADVLVQLFQIDANQQRKFIKQALTNGNGRLDQPLLTEAEITTGYYELLFHIGDYFNHQGSEVYFLNQVPIVVGLQAEESHYHIPLLISPFGYSTYRGS